MTYSKTRATKDNAAEYAPTQGVNSIDVAPLNRGTAATTPPTNSPDTLLVPNATQVRDRFAAPEYVNPNAPLPRIQALRGGVIRSV